MKKYLIIFLLIFNIKTLIAQENVFKIQFSPLSYNELNQTFKSNSSNYKTNFNPSFELAFIKSIGKFEFALNTKYSISNFSNYETFNNNTKVNETISINAKALSSIVKVDYDFYNGKKLILYSGVGLGVSKSDFNNEKLAIAYSFISDLEKLNGLAYQVDIIGLNYKLNKNLAVYSIISFGTNGLSQVGINYVFKN